MDYVKFDVRVMMRLERRHPKAPRLPWASLQLPFRPASVPPPPARLGETAFLRAAKRIGEGQALFHARQDEVAGAVDDSANGLDVVAGQPALQDADDRYRAADAGLESNRHAVRGRRRKQLRAARRE